MRSERDRPAMPAARGEVAHYLSAWLLPHCAGSRGHRLAQGIPAIIANDGCERFSYYGMKAILFVFLTRLLVGEGASSQVAEKEATEILHRSALRCMRCRCSRSAGRSVARKVPDHPYLSLAYCVGHTFLAVFEQHFTGFAFGLAFIALGAGGIKPCVSAHVGDQFGRSNWSKVERIYQLFYFIINFGRCSRPCSSRPSRSASGSATRSRSQAC